MDVVARRVARLRSRVRPRRRVAATRVGARRSIHDRHTAVDGRQIGDAPANGVAPLGRRAPRRDGANAALPCEAHRRCALDRARWAIAVGRARSGRTVLRALGRATRVDAAAAHTRDEVCILRGWTRHAFAAPAQDDGDPVVRRDLERDASRSDQRPVGARDSDLDDIAPRGDAAELGDARAAGEVALRQRRLGQSEHLGRVSEEEPCLGRSGLELTHVIGCEVDEDERPAAVAARRARDGQHDEYPCGASYPHRWE